MNILLIGYGKMGKEIAQTAQDRKHTIAGIVDLGGDQKITDFSPETVDVAIEFTEPSQAFENIKACLQLGIPVVSGTTGWIDRKPEIDAFCQEVNGTFFYASNFSIGVNLFFKINKQLAQLMNAHPQYNVRIEETHHLQKKDKPSGTAITLATGIIENMSRKKSWRLSDQGSAAQEISIKSLREPDVPGTHVVRFTSLMDDLEIKHVAHTRKSFAQGAVMAAEWCKQRKGVLSMDDLLQF